MFDFGWAELLLICGIALFVIGPKDIPAIAYQIGKLFRRLRYMQYAITGQFDDFMAKAEAKQNPMPDDEKMELDHDPYDEAAADADLMEMMPLPKEKDVQIQKLTNEYLEQSVALVKQCFEWYANNSGLPERSLRSAMDVSIADKYDDMQSFSNRQYWVALKNNEVVGIVGLMEMNEDKVETSWVNWFCVSPNHRGEKIGENLLNYIVDVGTKENKKHLKLWTSDSPNEKNAQFLYNKLGFEIESTEPHVEGDSTTLIYRTKILTEEGALS